MTLTEKKLSGFNSHGKILTTAKHCVGSLVPGAINIFPNLLQLIRTPHIRDLPFK